MQRRDPGFSVGGTRPVVGGGGCAKLRCECFLVKMYAKTKELGPVEEMHRSANGMCIMKLFTYLSTTLNLNINEPLPILS